MGLVVDPVDRFIVGVRVGVHGCGWVMGPGGAGLCGIIVEFGRDGGFIYTRHCVDTVFEVFLRAVRVSASVDTLGGWCESNFQIAGYRSG